MSKIMDGKKVSQDIKKWIIQRTKELKDRTGVVPGLASILVGNDPASEIYVRNKRRACGRCGMLSEEYNLPEETSEEELLSLIERLNLDEKIHGILVQLPLPFHMNPVKVIRKVSPDKDVDGFHPENTGNLFQENPSAISCTPYGIEKLLDYYDIEIFGKHVVVVGKSNIVGKPTAALMLNRDATVTIAHIETQNLPDITTMADILIIAIGDPKFIKKEMIKDGAVVVDVGINRNENGKIVGDVDFEDVKEKASYITPVPGGVGPMTITMLLWNTLEAAETFALGK
ncbi:MAG: bifunctional methylenetetrahydrofolate dehydrogenase/methenyltetrahydrofolate cyclohydrolase FolD [Candidatus Dadabacteria bacterium]|nr:bifunctional methylenetetrahydrofolate dehydrogenase/methenyltetrahydrofolate cyclohydrolase FolD [Candidatus Dadabacteria bacterium]